MSGELLKSPMMIHKSVEEESECRIKDVLSSKAVGEKYTRG